MAKTETSQYVILASDEAMALWREGKEAWNAWVEENPNANVDFSSQEFGSSSDHNGEAGHVNFSGYHFPNGRINFSGATFHAGHITFMRAKFGQSEINFDQAQFGNGQIIFNDVDFGKSIIRCFETAFGEGILSFSNANFEKARVLFYATAFHKTKVGFMNCTFGEAIRFYELTGLEEVPTFSFHGSSFEKLFTFSHTGKMGCPLDLRRTKISHNVVLNDVICEFEASPMPRWAVLASRYWSGMPAGSEPVWRWACNAKEKEDSQRFRRLKELALNNRNHAKALEFHVQEIRTRRGHETNWVQNAGQTLYWALGDYGRSVFRPFSWLLALWSSFGYLFYNWRDVEATSFSTALSYSGSHILSFIPIGRTARLQGEELLFGKDMPTPDWAIGLGAIEAILAVILLFLLGLGLRNMFRV
ncbi:hypothetical protein [Qipengyuania sp. DGS5-3]|uniref:hypothetical protein n=1 Tax=Qipengyuania sp. DGS5-3 TaxID=3349632 RepID=UPI0036D299AF